MLRITPQRSASGAKTYFAQADYYLSDQELPGAGAGVWRGKAAARLGLSGEVQRRDWEALCDNLDPRDGRPLTPKTVRERRVGYDFTFNAPKSVSILYAMTQDGRILSAFRDAVDGAMREAELEMKTRVRVNGSNEDRTTGNMVWGEFTHLTTRPIDGVPDPHLHVHAFAFNLTWDPAESRFKAGQFGGIKRDAPYFEAVFHSILAERLARLGLSIERTKTGWEIEGFARATIDKFSRRTAKIEALAQEQGITNPDAKGALGARTREPKAKGQAFAELARSWRARLTPEETIPLLVNQHRLESGLDEFSDDSSHAREACANAISHAFERKSVVPERVLQADAIRKGVGRSSWTTTLHELKRQGLLSADRDGRRMATTREVLAEEQAVLSFAREGRGTCPRMGARGSEPFSAADYAFIDPRLNADQRNAVLHVLNSNDRVVVVRGAAGVGKTTMMTEAIHAIEATGTKVITVAPSADASRGVLRREGFADADTLSRLLVDETLQEQARGHVIWVDEAGLVSTKAMRALFDLAQSLHARVVLSGDTRQHTSVERGDALRLLEREAGLAPAEIKEIQRQKDKYKLLVRDLSEGRVADAFARLDQLGWIKEVEGEERTRAIAQDYVESTMKGVETLVVSPTHAEGDAVAAEIRSQLKQRGQFTQGRTFRSLVSANLTVAERSDPVNYTPGDVIVFHQNAPGIVKGQRVVVGEDATSLPLHLAERFTVFHPRAIELAPGDKVRITKGGTTLDGASRLNNGEAHVVKGFAERTGDIVLDDGKVISKDFGHLAHGYVVTSHASQGRSVPKVILAQSSASFPASSREQFYVSVSRGKQQCVVYTDDKQALLEAVQESDDRPTATEMLRTPATQSPTIKPPGIKPLGTELTTPTPEQRRRRVRVLQQGEAHRAPSRVHDRGRHPAPSRGGGRLSRHNDPQPQERNPHDR
jgi:conjugative relaxase-like TrwC/TraI family protein